MFEREYFDWMQNLVCGRRYSNHISYDRLLRYLHNTTFVYSIPRDENRASDGENLRSRFCHEYGYGDSRIGYDTPCSVLEMMIALAIRCEEDVMDDPAVGDRTGQWFWGMIVSLGLGSMTDNRFDEDYVRSVVRRFLDREYEPNGRGGLFTIRNCDEDLRDVEIWYQMCWYLNTIT